MRDILLVIGGVLVGSATAWLIFNYAMRTMDAVYQHVAVIHQKIDAVLAALKQ
jgi:hypothetical protein